MAQGEGTNDPAQPELSFDRDSRGYSTWIEQRQEALSRLANAMGLPLGHSVEVWLVGEIRLRGVLKLRDELLFVEAEPDANLHLSVDGVSFTTKELESCVRLD